MVGIAFLIAMIGIASSILGGLYFFCSETTTLPMMRRSAVSGSLYRTGSSIYSSSEPNTFPVFRLTKCAWAHARHVT